MICSLLLLLIWLMVGAGLACVCQHITTFINNASFYLINSRTISETLDYFWLGIKIEVLRQLKLA
jgi:hypothetical protein